MVRVAVNGSPTELDAPSGQSLLGVLRDDLGLTGTKYGCGEGKCGACTVLVDRSPVRACTVAVNTLEGAAITTVEGLAGERGLHPVQQAFVDARALQCGYCTPGMVMNAGVATDPRRRPALSAGWSRALRRYVPRGPDSTGS